MNTAVRSHEVAQCSSVRVAGSVAGSVLSGAVQMRSSAISWQGRPSGAPAGVLQILNRSPFAPGAPRGAGWGLGRARCGAGARSAGAAIAPVPKKGDRFLL